MLYLHLDAALSLSPSFGSFPLPLTYRLPPIVPPASSDMSSVIKENLIYGAQLGYGVSMVPHRRSRFKMNGLT